MKLRILYLIVGLTIGFTTGVYTYSTVFDPNAYWQEAKVLGFETARLGCVKAGKSFEECTEIAKEIYKMLNKN